MNKFVASVLGGLVVAGGIAGGYFYANSETNEPKQEVKAKQANVKQEEKASAEQEAKEVAKLPELTRTVDIGPNKPWQYYKPEYMLEKIEQEQFYLWDDAAEFEDLIISEYKLPETYEGLAKYIESFILDLQPFYPDKQAYFDKMREIEEMFKNGKTDKVPQLIEEAKQLREAE
jgi:isochorismate synthase EntC